MKSAWVAVYLAGMLSACGGGEDGEPLLSGSVSGSYDGDSFSAEFGYATIVNDQPAVLIGTGDLYCGKENDSNPPSGFNAAISVPSFEVGSYSSVFVQMFRSSGGFEGVGSNVGTVELTAASAESIAGSVSFDYTDDESKYYSLSGTFEVLRCQ